MVIPRFVQAAITGAPLEIHGDGTQTRTFCHVSDTVAALTGLVGEQPTAGQIYNVGSPDSISIAGLAERVLEETGSASELVRVPYDRVYGLGIEDTLHRVPSIEKISAAIGWEPERTLDEILADVIAHTRELESVELA
jgi:UDP-glucose 4-epimerase